MTRSNTLSDLGVPSTAQETSVFSFIDSYQQPEFDIAINAILR